MMDCRQVRAALPLYARNELPQDEAREVERHLATCPECRSEAASWRGDLERATALLKQADPTELDPEALDAMIAVAVEHLPGDRRGSRPWSSRPSISRPSMSKRRAWVSLAAAAAVVALVAWPLSRTFQDHPDHDTWDALQAVFQGCLSPPVPLDQWKATEGPGVVAVLAPGHNGDLVLAACLESPDLSRLKSYPWARQRIRAWEEATGQAELLVAVCRTEMEDPVSRRRMQQRALEEAGG